MKAKIVSYYMSDRSTPEVTAHKLESPIEFKEFRFFLCRHFKTWSAHEFTTGLRIGGNHRNKTQAIDNFIAYLKVEGITSDAMRKTIKVQTDAFGILND